MRLSSLLVASMAVVSVGAFAPPAQSSFAVRSSLANSATSFSRSSSTRAMTNHHPEGDIDSMDSSSSSSSIVDATIVWDNGIIKMAGTTLGIWASTASMASAAAGPDWGIFEGRTGSLLHPLMMGGLLLYSLYTAFLGFQWRRQRTMGDDIATLKKSLPDLGGASTVKAALAAAQTAEEVDATRVRALEAALSVDQQIQDLQTERKELAAKGPRDQHFNQGALLAFLGTTFAIVGPLNTFARAGKLFPGPHLYAGAGLVVLWALAASCVPYMQKGNDTARSIHIGANAAGIALFAWQVTTGIPILLKVVELTQWP